MNVIVPTMFTKLSSQDIWKQTRWWMASSVAVVLMNIPILSYGLALGWVSFATGDRAETAWDPRVVLAATVTFLATLVAMPGATKALLYGRKPTLIAASVFFAICWSFKLAGSSSLSGGAWWVVGGRAAGGVAGAAAWCAAPLMTAESVGAGASAVGSAAAHNAGMLFMYIASALKMDNSVVLWCCLLISLSHAFLMLFIPESPPFLAAQGRHKEAVRSLAWLQWTSVDDSQLEQKLSELPPPEVMPTSLWAQSKEMFKSKARRRAFYISCYAVIGQEVSGVLALLQYAERTLTDAGAGDEAGAGRAVILGVVQLVFSILALPLIDRVGRRPLLLGAAFTVSLCLCAGAVAARYSARGAAAALAAAVAADAAGLQTVPYALLADMFHYQYRGCALTLAAAAAALGNAAEVFIFPVAAYLGGVVTSLAVAATACFLYAMVLVFIVPETRNRTLDEIYDEIAPGENKSVSTRI